MARKIIDIGTIGNDGTGDSIRDSFRKVNDNFRELYSILGLGERLTFIGLEDTPDTFAGNENAVLSIAQDPDADEGLSVKFKQIIGDVGITIDNDSNPNEIRIRNNFSEISADGTPQLGGNLSAVFGGVQYRIQDLTTPVSDTEAVNKDYADGKVSLAGVDAIDSATGQVDSRFGQMSGPLILSRNPEPDDDATYGGLIAATKQYVDGAAATSEVNLYVSTSGEDDRPSLNKEVQGRALSYAYKTIEAALKRAEEIMLESQNEIGPYEKLLTFNAGEGICTLGAVETSPVSGSGFAASPLLSVSTISLNTPGSGYNAGEILELRGGTGTAATIEILSTNGAFGPILTFRVVSSGNYSVLPGAAAVPLVDAIVDGADTNGLGATFDITYSVNNVQITNSGSGYSLVSVRVTGGGGTGAFGTATVDGGEITEVEIVDAGSGFTSLPTVTADLPRFLVNTEGFRTDFTGDVLSDTPEAFRTRDIREGLFLKGVNSGALAQIVGHDGSLDSEGREFFDVDIQFGAFEIGEPITYGDRAKQQQITVLIESGIYEENYPLKIPPNVAIVGNEFRRVLIRPRAGTSSSPWAFQKFRRDLEIDGLTTADRLFGYHYLQDSSAPVYPKIDNGGGYNKAASLIDLNRNFLKEEIVAWIDYQIENAIAPFGVAFEYNENNWKSSFGAIIDSYIFDLKYGEYNRTISEGLKFYQTASGRLQIGDQLQETIASIQHLKTLIQSVTQNTAVSTVYQSTRPQIIDAAIISEDGVNDKVTLLNDALIDVIDGSGSVNYPKENNQLDVFLCNDTNIIRAVTCQGHGGFMMVLDPTGQILAKSPYAQECASFSRSIDAQIFAGGMFVDGFAGNLEFQILSKDSSTRLRVEGLDRFPELPASFIVRDTVYRINYVRDFQYSPNGSTATFVLDETTPWPFEVLVYDDEDFTDNVELMIDGLGYDLVLGTNFNTRRSGLTIRKQNTDDISLQVVTLEAIELTHELASEIVSLEFSASVIDLGENISDIVERGPFYAPVLSFTEPTGLASAIKNAKDLLLENLEFIKDETVGYLNATYPTLDYSPSNYKKDIEIIIESLTYDVLYGGNSQTVNAGLDFYDDAGDPLFDTDIKTEIVDGIDYAKDLAKLVIVNGTPAINYTATPQVTGSASDASNQTVIEDLMSDLSSIVNNGVGSAPSITYPNLNAYSYSASAKTSRTALQTNKSSIQSDVLDRVDSIANKYEVLMPGNRSMLSNDYTQVADMGYGLLATNGGLTEAVSMFTYYCYTSYLSVNGAQIRSIGGSSAHGIYALVAQGSDPLEVPTPTELFFDNSQRVDCYFPSATYKNEIGGLEIFVTNYDYAPRSNSELEVDHGNIIFRYPVATADTSGLPEGVSRLNLTSDGDDGAGSTDGLFAAVPDGTKMTIRSNSQVVLTGGLEDVAVRPSTGLILNETANRVDTEGLAIPDLVYRVLQFSAIDDERGPIEVAFTATSPTDVSVLATGTEITGTDTITTSYNSGLRLNDPIVPQQTANGLTADQTYFVSEIVKYDQIKVSESIGGSNVVLVNGTGLTLKFVVPHKLIVNYTISFDTDDTLPTGLTAGETYFISSEGLENLTFRITEDRNGSTVNLSDTGTGTHSYAMIGLTDTILRENYDYIGITLNQPGEFKSLTNCTIPDSSSPDPVEISTSGAHGLSAGDAIGFAKFLDEDRFPSGISDVAKFFVYNPDPDGVGAGSTKFTVSLAPPNLITAEEVITEGGGNTTSFQFGLIDGITGDETVAVTALSTNDANRVVGSKFVFLGEEYIISGYENTTDTGEVFARLTFNRPLVDSLQDYEGAYTIKAAVPVRTRGAEGRLTIRISLTRVTSHDLLEIGTGSYADTNYPNEIYGPPVNVINQGNETQERDVGRVFYVTTDQFGNFRVGPYFTVDQGTGKVEFSAAIALSNLDGLGFKRGVQVSEFSIDAAMVDNATDTVPTENAVRSYIEKRLGVSHGGSRLDDVDMIPAETGGFMALSGQLAMRQDMNLGDNKITNVADPELPQDAVNLQSLTFDNFQDFSSSNTEAADLIVFTGNENNTVNATVVGDVTFDLRTGTDSALNQIDVQIKPDTIVNGDIKLPTDNTEFTADAILQSKLRMNVATTRASAPTGTAQTKQADLGVSTFNSAQFTATDGWISLKDNGITIGKLQTISTDTVIGNSTGATATPTQVAFTTVVDEGGAIKKTQYNSTGFLRRTVNNPGSPDTDFTLVDMAAGTAANPEASKLIVRNALGNFGANVADLSQLKIDNKVAIDSATTSTGGYIQYYPYGGTGGLLLYDGSLGTDARNEYWNDSHVFKAQSGVGNAPITCSQINTLKVSAGSQGTAGTIEGQWTLVGTSTFEATYAADLAEYYEGDTEYEVGTVLVFGGEKEVTTTKKYADTRVAGVISNNAAYIMNGACSGNKNLIALAGRVLCKVVGKIEKGDLMTTSEIQGVACAVIGDAKTGTIIGKALENYDSDTVGTIEVAVGRN